MPKKKTAWMLFRVEGENVSYFWDSRIPVLVQWPLGEDKDAWLWRKGLMTGEDIPEEEILTLTKVAETPRKRNFKVKRKTDTFIVDQRGIFTEEEY